MCNQPSHNNRFNLSLSPNGVISRITVSGSKISSSKNSTLRKISSKITLTTMDKTDTTTINPSMTSKRTTTNSNTKTTAKTKLPASMRSSNNSITVIDTTTVTSSSHNMTNSSTTTTISSSKYLTITTTTRITTTKTRTLTSIRTRLTKIIKYSSIRSSQRLNRRHKTKRSSSK